MYSCGMYIGLNVIPIEVLWGSSICHMSTWTLSVCKTSSVYLTEKSIVMLLVFDASQDF